MATHVFVSWDTVACFAKRTLMNARVHHVKMVQHVSIKLMATSVSVYLAIQVLIVRPILMNAVALLVSMVVHVSIN